MRAFFAATSIAIALVTAWACLPDLGIGQPPSVCGDGFVDPSAGEECDPGTVGDAGGTSNACVTCKVTCVVGGYTTFEDPATQHCYFQVGQTATATTAVADCEAWGGHIVRLVSEAELALVAKNAVTDPFWIGISRTSAGVWHPIETTYEPGWAANCAGCFAQVDGGTIPSDPSETDPSGTCVIGHEDLAASWTDSQCSAPNKKDFFRHTICEREPLGSRARACDANLCLTVAATQSTKKYVLVGGAVDAGAGLVANDAVGACAALGGRLAILGSREEREQLGRELGAYFGGVASAWIGLSDANGTWGWDAPGGITPPPWGVGEPAAITGSAGRAYVTIDATRLDSELAHAATASDAGSELHAALCEVP